MKLTIEKVLILKSVDIFANTSEKALAGVAAALEEIEVMAGENVFEKGTMGNAMYIIVDGKVRVHDGDYEITTMTTRDIVGELAVLDPFPRSASVTAIEDTVLFRLDQEVLYDLMSGHVEVVRGVIRALCRRLREQTENR